MRLLSRRLLFLMLLVPVCQYSSFACSCFGEAPGPCISMKKLGVVFIGTVIDIENPPDKAETFAGGVSRYRFRVDENIAGMNLKEVDVYSGRGGADCSYHFRINEQYLVFPYAEEDQRLFATIAARHDLSKTRSLFFRNYVRAEMAKNTHPCTEYFYGPRSFTPPQRPTTS